VAAAVFTGLIGDVGRVVRVAGDADGATFTIATALAGELREGDSVAVCGVCLTASAIADGSFVAQAMGETLRRSTLGALRSGDEVNLELPLTAGARLGGHVVQGHVDAAGTVLSTREDGFARILRVAAPDGLARYLVEKGSVALDGVSLTISALDGDGDGGWFEVSLIPETLRRTTLGGASAGTEVNVEVDVLAKHVERLLAPVAAAGASGGPATADGSQEGNGARSRAERR
jgi:riboflavin synthase